MRGVAGEEPLTPETLERLGRILAGELRAGAGEVAAPQVLVGHDGRESGETLAAALIAGLNRGGVDVDMVGLAPTPCVACLTAQGPYAAGIVVSASHNPAPDNGVKLLGAGGAKLDDAVEARLEAALHEGRLPAEARQAGSQRRVARLVGDYVAWLRNEAFPDLDLKGWSVVVDTANGACSEVAPRILRAFGAEAIPIHDHPDGRNINQGCGALHPEVAAQAVVQQGATAGLSLDGDGDRGLLADTQGRILDGDALLAGLAPRLHAAGRLPHGTVVATVMSNLALEQWLAARGLSLVRTPVGDRHVAARMRKDGFHLGGEKSGHLLFGPEHDFRGDGLYTFLKAATLLREKGEDPTALASGYEDLPQDLRNLPVSRRAPLEELPRLQQAIREAEKQLAGRGRTVVRFSGTELRLRLMVEADAEDLVRSTLDQLEAAAREEGILA